MQEQIDLRNYDSNTLIIDIDGVLAQEKKQTPYYTLLPVDEAARSLEVLKQKGFNIVLHTARFEFERQETIDWLAKNGFLYDDIKFGKPRGLVYIDDRGYRFKNWQQFFQDVIL